MSFAAQLLCHVKFEHTGQMLNLLLCGRHCVNRGTRRLDARHSNLKQQGLSHFFYSLSTFVSQILGVRDISFTDIIDRQILPALVSEQATQLPAATLVSYLAFISLSGLLSCAKFDAKIPDSPYGRKLLKQLLQCAVLCTNKGPVKLETGVAIHFPASLGNQVGTCFAI